MEIVADFIFLDSKSLQTVTEAMKLKDACCLEENYDKSCCCFSRVRLSATPYMAAHQVPLSLGFSRQEHWSGVPLPSPDDKSRKLIKKHRHRFADKSPYSQSYGFFQ